MKRISKRLKVFIIITLFFFVWQSNCQNILKTSSNNYSDISKFTFGINKTYYKNSKSYNESDENIVALNIDSQPNFFLDYRVLSYNNHALKIGVFLNSLQKTLKHSGLIFDLKNNEYIHVDGAPYSDRNEKLSPVEFYINYSYLLKVNSKLLLDFNFGISLEKNKSVINYSEDYYLGDIDFIAYQLYNKNSHILEKDFYRYNLGSNFVYKNSYGMINLGFKYSIPFVKILKRKSSFYDPGSNNENYVYDSKFSLSGEYLSLILSFTPSRHIFKKNKTL